MVSTGLRLVMGSWKIMPSSLPRNARFSHSGISSRFTRRPSRRTNHASPSTCACEVLACRPMSVRLVTDLPEPDSPTSASVSPGWIENETSATLWMRPASVAKEVDRLRTSSRGDAMAFAFMRPSSAWDPADRARPRILD